MAGTRFNAETVKEKILESGTSYAKLSTLVLDRSPSYIGNCLERGVMSEDELKKLCKFIDLKYNDVLIKDEPKTKTPVKKEEKSDAAGVPAKDYSDKIDLLTVGLETLYTGQVETNKLLKELIQEIKVSNQKLERLEKKVNTIENATGQTYTRSIAISEHTGNTNEHLREIKSTLATIKGRSTDIRDELVKNPRSRIAAVK